LSAAAAGHLAHSVGPDDGSAIEGEFPDAGSHFGDDDLLTTVADRQLTPRGGPCLVRAVAHVSVWYNDALTDPGITEEESVRVLVTNDDGVHAPGLGRLTRVLRDGGHDVVVAAPLAEASGAGAGVGPIHTMGDGIVMADVSLPGLEDVVAYGVDALPALIVIVACLGAFGPAPDLVVSGINPGRNVGRAALHSGTVGAALTAVHFNKRALAVSVQSGPFSGFESADDSHIHFDTAASIAVALLSHLAESPVRTVLNCNVPNLPLGALRGIRWAHLARSGLVRSVAVDPSGEPRLQLDLGFAEPQAGDESDQALTTLGYVSVTPLASVTEDIRPSVRDTIGSSIASVAAQLGITDRPTRDEAQGPAA